MLNCTAMCRSMDKKPCGNILKSPVKSVFTANAIMKHYMGGAVMQKNNPTVSNPVMSVVKGWHEKTATNLALKPQTASDAGQFTIVSGDSSAAIAGYKPGKPLPLCRVTGTE